MDPSYLLPEAQQYYTNHPEPSSVQGVPAPLPLQSKADPFFPGWMRFAPGQSKEEGLMLEKKEAGAEIITPKNDQEPAGEQASVINKATELHDYPVSNTVFKDMGGQPQDTLPTSSSTSSTTSAQHVDSNENGKMPQELKTQKVQPKEPQKEDNTGNGQITSENKIIPKSVFVEETVNGKERQPGTSNLSLTYGTRVVFPLLKKGRNRPVYPANLHSSNPTGGRYTQASKKDQELSMQKPDASQLHQSSNHALSAIEKEETNQTVVNGPKVENNLLVTGRNNGERPTLRNDESSITDREESVELESENENSEKTDASNLKQSQG
jgi:hypothetical protein